MRHQHTIARSCQVRGRGYWSGRSVVVNIHPAAADTGILLVRTDLAGGPSCPASIDFQQEASLRTNLMRGEARFEMVEHLMAALAALQIDNARVEIDGWELPGLDGSSLAFVEALSASGLVLQAARRQRYVIQTSHRIGDRRGWIRIDPTPENATAYEYQLSFDDPDIPIPPQAFSFTCRPSSFIRSVASARTFVTAEQADAIRASGAASHVSDADLVVIDHNGQPRVGEFRFSNECARHKALDMVGDLALCNFDIIGRVTSFRGGHVLNGRMAKRLAVLARQRPFGYKRTAA